MRTSRKSWLIGTTPPMPAGFGSTGEAPSRDDVQSWVEELTGGEGPERSPAEWRRVLTEVVEQLMTAGEWPGFRGSPKLLIDEIVLRAGAPGDEEKRKVLRTVLVEQLEKSQGLNERIFILREMAIIGREECVRALEKLLEDPQAAVREYALRALQANPSKKAGETLLAALNRASDSDARVAIVNALGSRRAKEAAEPLGQLLDGEKDEKVAQVIRAAIAHLKVCE